MYYLQALVLFAAILVCLCCNGKVPCHWNEIYLGPKYQEFETFASRVITSDTNEQSYCRALSASPVKEVHTRNLYQIAIPATGEGNYVVRVKGRVLLVSSQDCDDSVTQVRVLPTYVNAYSGTWCMMQEGLVVSFPTRFDLSRGGATIFAPSSYSTTLRHEIKS